MKTRDEIIAQLDNEANKRAGIFGLSPAMATPLVLYSTLEVLLDIRDLLAKK
jgi:hypothetical protein